MGTSSFRNDGLDLWLKRPQLFPSWVGKIKRRRSSYVTHPEEEFFMSKLGTGGSRPSRERGNISHRKGFSRTNHRLQSGFLKVGDICDRSREGYFLFLSVFFLGLKPHSFCKKHFRLKISYFPDSYVFQDVFFCFPGFLFLSCLFVSSHSEPKG